MSLFSIIPPLMSVGKLLRARRKSLLVFLKDLPDSFSDCVRFLLTGSPNPWLVHETVPLNPISISALEQYWPVGEVSLTLKQALRPTWNTCTVCLLWLVANAADVGWIMACVLTNSGGLNGFSTFFLKMSKLVQFRTHVHLPTVHTMRGDRFPFLVCNFFKYLVFVCWVSCACYSVHIWLLRLLDQYSRVDSIFW